jgi:uncharacterized protein YjbJ (UPF0337 family)
MDGNRIEGNWEQLKRKVKEQWGKLTDDDPHADQKDGETEAEINRRWQWLT